MKKRVTPCPGNGYSLVTGFIRVTGAKVLCWSLFLIPLPARIYAQIAVSDIGQNRTHLEEAFITDAFILSTSVVEAHEDIPKHLLIRGYSLPENYFLMRFPLENWNEKLFVGGCGLGCGTLPNGISGNLKMALQRGYATATTNSGHWGASVRDFSWAYSNPQAETDYAHRAVHETVRVAREYMVIFYGRNPAHSYFWGCSGGGRQGVVSAARYPEDFDGIIAEAPALDLTGWSLYAAWLRQANTGPDGRDILTKEDLAKISKAVYARCDVRDGNADGLIREPKECAFDPEVLLCQEEENCLSIQKVDVLKKWYQGPNDKSGKALITSGIPVGSEPHWGFWMLGESAAPNDEFTPWNEVFQYLFFQDDPGRSYSVMEFDFEDDPKRLAYMGALLNATHLPIQQFKDQGGKLLMYHGLSDPMIPYQNSIDYFKRNQELFGNSIFEFFRLFLIPGMDHCTAFALFGITGQSLDPLTALENWVEKAMPPEELSITRFEADGAIRSQFGLPFYAGGN